MVAKALSVTVFSPTNKKRWIDGLDRHQKLVLKIGTANFAHQLIAYVDIGNILQIHVLRRQVRLAARASGMDVPRRGNVLALTGVWIFDIPHLAAKLRDGATEVVRNQLRQIVAYPSTNLGADDDAFLTPIRAASSCCVSPSILRRCLILIMLLPSVIMWLCKCLWSRFLSGFFFYLSPGSPEYMLSMTSAR